MGRYMTSGASSVDLLEASILFEIKVRLKIICILNDDVNSVFDTQGRQVSGFERNIL